MVGLLSKVKSAVGKLRKSYENLRDAFSYRKELVSGPLSDSKSGKNYYEMGEGNFRKFRNNLVRKINGSLKNAAHDDFEEGDSDYLRMNADHYADLFDRYGKIRLIDNLDDLSSEHPATEFPNRKYFMGQKNKKAMLTLEALTRMRADYVKSGGDESFKKYVLDNLYTGDVSCVEDKSDESYALVSKYGVLHSDILEAVFEFRNGEKRELVEIYDKGLKTNKREKREAYSSVGSF